MKVWQILLIVCIILAIVLIVLYFVGRKLQKKQDEQQVQIEAAKQQVNMLIIDKKMMPLKQSGLPQQVIDGTPKWLRGRKAPIVKAKVGPKVMTMIADEKIFDIIPVKKEVKATIAGLYITDVKAIRGQLATPPQKKTFRQKLLGAKDKALGMQKEAEASKPKKKKK